MVRNHVHASHVTNVIRNNDGIWVWVLLDLQETCVLLNPLYTENILSKIYLILLICPASRVKRGYLNTVRDSDILMGPWKYCMLTAPDREGGPAVLLLSGRSTATTLISTSKTQTVYILTSLVKGPWLKHLAFPGIASLCSWATQSFTTCLQNPRSTKVGAPAFWRYRPRRWGDISTHTRQGIHTYLAFNCLKEQVKMRGYVLIWWSIYFSDYINDLSVLVKERC